MFAILTIRIGMGGMSKILRDDNDSILIAGIGDQLQTIKHNLEGTIPTIENTLQSIFRHDCIINVLYDESYYICRYRQIRSLN